MKKEGIEPIETVGKPFDPNKMEAVEETDGRVIYKDNTRTHIEPGDVVDEVQKGYTMYGKLIRPAKVKIFKELNK